MHIEDGYDRLSEAENNLQYIKALHSLKFWMERFANSLSPEECLASAEYQQIFFTGCGFAPYDRVINSIMDYEYGNRPF